jgi:hypothetical protein
MPAVTPVLRSRTLDALAGAQLAFKAEHLQRGGAFKFRGACNAVWSLDAGAAACGVVTHSSGNHGAALALARAPRHSLPRGGAGGRGGGQAGQHRPPRRHALALPADHRRPRGHLRPRAGDTGACWCIPMPTRR